MKNPDTFIRDDDQHGSHSYFENGRLATQEKVTFNETGKFSEWRAFDENGAVKEIRTWQFNHDRKIVEWGYFHGDVSLNYKETARYDVRGNRTEYVSRDGVEHYTFNEQNLETSRTRTTLSGTLMFRYIREYDDAGNKVLERYIDLISEQETVYQYDEQNRLITYEVREYDASGQLLEDSDRIKWYRIELKYDADDNVIREMLFDRHGVYQYDVL